MRKSTLVVLLLLASVALGGCFGSYLEPSGKETPTENGGQQAGDQEIDDKHDKNGAQADVQQPEQIGDKQEANRNEISIHTLKEQLYVNMTQQEVEELLGKQYTSVSSSMDNTLLWRYDIGAVEGYKSIDDEYDSGDIDGLLAGDIDLQVFVEWDDTMYVIGYSAIYFNEADGKVYSYHMFGDGFEKEQAITN